MPRSHSNDTNDTSDIYVAGLASTTGYPRPAAASPVSVALVPAYDECTSPNVNHPAPFAGGACNPPTLASGYLTVGTPDANGAPAKSSGYVKIKVLEGTPGGADDSDASLEVILTDVRNQGSLSDYTGELRLVDEAAHHRPGQRPKWNRAGDRGRPAVRRDRAVHRHG